MTQDDATCTRPALRRRLEDVDQARSGTDPEGVLDAAGRSGRA